MFCVALDDQSGGITPFDVDVFLVDAGEFTLKLIRFLELLDVEVWFERPGCAGLASRSALIVVDEAEDGREFLEERHGWYV